MALFGVKITFTCRVWKVRTNKTEKENKKYKIKRFKNILKKCIKTVENFVDLVKKEEKMERNFILLTWKKNCIGNSKLFLNRHAADEE